MLGKNPKIIPAMSIEHLPEEDRFIDLTNTRLRGCCVGDLLLIKAMLIGVLNNYSNYKDKNKIAEFAQDAFIKLTPVIIQSLNQVSKLI